MWFLWFVVKFPMKLRVTLYSGDYSYISLIRKNDDDSIEYWLGMFIPKGTAVPEGYEMIDFPKSTLGVCAVYGKEYWNIVTIYNSCFAD